MKNNERLLGRILSQQELQLVSGGDIIALPPITTTPKSDGCSDDNGNLVDCETGIPKEIEEIN